MPQERKTRAPNPEAKRELRGGLKDSRRSREKKMGEHQGRAGEEKSQRQEGTEQDEKGVKRDRARKGENQEEKRHSPDSRLLCQPLGQAA